jgi:hypothetical protein
VAGAKGDQSTRNSLSEGWGYGEGSVGTSGKTESQPYLRLTGGVFQTLKGELVLLLPGIQVFVELDFVA